MAAQKLSWIHYCPSLAASKGLQLMTSPELQRTVIALLAVLSFLLGSPCQQEHAQACLCSQLPVTNSDMVYGAGYVQQTAQNLALCTITHLLVFVCNQLVPGVNCFLSCCLLLAVFASSF